MKKHLLKISMYGSLYLFYTSAFLFGVLYPQFGIPKNVCEKEQIEKYSYIDETSDIQYKSYILEQLKKIF